MRSWASRWAWVRSSAGAPDEQGGGSMQGRSSPSLVQTKQRTRRNSGKAAAGGRRLARCRRTWRNSGELMTSAGRQGWSGRTDPALWSRFDQRRGEGWNEAKMGFRSRQSWRGGAPVRQGTTEGRGWIRPSIPSQIRQGLEVQEPWHLRELLRSSMAERERG